MINCESGLYCYKLNFYTISPLHIGVGNYIDPFSYVIQNGHLYYFDFTKFVMLIDDIQRKELLNRISNPGEAAIIPVRKFLADLFNYEKHISTLLYDYELKHKDTIRYYDERFFSKKKDKINSLFINTIYRNHSNNAIIPGSSIKGVIRNAFIKANQLELVEKDLKINQDTFRFVKIFDGVRNKRTNVNIAFLYNILKDKLELGNTQTYLIEYIAPKQSFPVDINIDLRNSFVNKEYYDKILTNMKNGTAIIKMLNKFYQPKFEKLYDIILKQAGEEHPFIKNVKECKASVKNAPIAFIHLGKYGGQEMYNNEMLNKLKYRRYLSYNEIKKDSDLITQNLMPLGWVAVL